MKQSFTYADSGVDIEKANALIPEIKRLAKTTNRPGVMGDIGGFGGLFSLNTNHFERPVLVSSTDGVGTKLRIAFMMDKHDTIGIDLVAMSVNDIVVQGAKPLFFLDYISSGHLKPSVIVDIIKGIAVGCREADCALIGGETAEMPDFFQKDEYDVCGFSVGIVDNAKIIDGSGISVGHQLIGIASSGLHSNGFSLARKICFEALGHTIDSYLPELNQPLGECLLTPTRIYSEMLQPLIRDFKIGGLAHITGGGLIDNVARILPKSCKAVIKQSSWDMPPIFSLLKDAGNVSDLEMLRTFNNGIGMVIVVPGSQANEILERLKAMQEKAWIIGDIQAASEHEAQTIFV
ncbi:MAG: phosphoribosylformylglycinamidine cyclo-ligase [Candidatus Magnetomorum sp.]|nr:phosphoribosylformylglycinamidine cyclo-ligase [Candidatus Magnetomorum sp.]